jgi:hypothetical protein
MAKVVAYYLKTLVGVLVVFGLAWFAARWASARAPVLCRDPARMVTFLIASALLLVAGIGRLGWDIQTPDGESPMEKLDQAIFFALSLVGTFLFVFEYIAGRLAK